MAEIFMSQVSRHPLALEDEGLSHFTSFARERNTHFLYPFMFADDIVHDQGNDRDNWHFHYQAPAAADCKERKSIGEESCEISAPLLINLAGATTHVDMYYQLEPHGSSTPSKTRNSIVAAFNPDAKSTANNKRPRTSKARAGISHDHRPISQNGEIDAAGGMVRVCSDCFTTRTPLWRSGPSGPKSLCNACGIRQRKARKALALASANGSVTPTADRHPRKSKKEVDVVALDRSLPFKKRLKMPFTSTTPVNKQCPVQKKKHSLLEFDAGSPEIGLSTPPNLHLFFPQDETEAATLLMDLSCGITRS